MFDSGQELLDLCSSENKSIYEITIDSEIKNTGIDKDKLFSKMKDILSIMEEAANFGLDKEIQTMGGLLDNDAMKLEKYKESKKTFSGKFVLDAAAKALSVSQVNAAMGKIVAAPTAGAAGIMPAILFSCKENYQFTEEDLIKGLFTSSAVGQIIAKNATISGAEGGCQAECGSAASMAAAALVEMAGGSPEQVLHAASFALTHIMGLICDPVAGLVEYPCALRNASGVSNAYLSADLALAGMESLIPFDEVVESMYEVGNLMPSCLKETSLGGLATTPTGESIKNKLRK